MLNPSEIETILVRVPNWVGDVVMSLPALEALKANFPKSSLSVLTRPWAKDLLVSLPCVDHLLVYDPGSSVLERFKGIVQTAEFLRHQQFDLAVLFQNAFEAALLAWLGKVKYRLGYPTDGRGPLLTHRVKKSRDDEKRHQVHYYLDIVRGMGLAVRNQNPKILVTSEQKKKAQKVLEQIGVNRTRPVLGLGPGAMYGEAKKWPPERFAALGDMAAEAWGANILILGSERERHIGEAVTRAMNHVATNLCGVTSLGTAIGLLSLCDFFVTNDSGLMHISAALGVPTIAIFGSTDPAATGPLSDNAVVIRHQVDCAPCFKRTCPTDFRCMLSITPEEVWSSLERFRRDARQLEASSIH